MKLNYFFLVLVLLAGFQQAVYCNNDAVEAAETDFGFTDFDQLQAVDYELQGRLETTSDAFWGRLFNLCMLSGVVHVVGVTSLDDVKQLWSDGRYSRLVWLVTCCGIGTRQVFSMYGDMQQIVAYAQLREEIRSKVRGLEHAQSLLGDMEDFSFSEEGVA